MDPSSRTALPRLVRVGLFVGSLGLVAYFTAPTESGPPAKRWLDELPWVATKQGYSLYRLWERGSSFRGGRLARYQPNGPLAVDRWHTSKQPYDAYLTPSARDYEEMHGLGRAFDPLRLAQVPFRELGFLFAWDARVALDGASALFINLPSGDGPGFRWSEVRQIVAFIRSGGGLLLLTDHSDCYAHLDMLAQLSAELGIELLPVTAADPRNGLGIRAKSWIRSSTISPHPVTEGVDVTGWMNAGGVSGMEPLVQSSDSSWPDLGEPGKRDSAGFTGDLEQQPSEVGPVVLAGAKEFGAGRVVVLADQNAFGATMIGYGDNQRLFLNALGWVMHREFDPLAPEVVTLGVGCADAYEHGFRTFQVALAAVGRDACEGETAAEKRVILPSAENVGELPLVRTVRLAGGLNPGFPLAWTTIGNLPGSRIFATDGRQVPVVFERNAELIVAASLLDNTSLGGERDNPSDPAHAEGQRVKGAVLRWLFFDRDLGG